MIQGINAKIQRQSANFQRLYPTNAQPQINPKDFDDSRKNLIAQELYHSVFPRGDENPPSLVRSKVNNGSSLPKDEFRINGGVTGDFPCYRPDKRATVKFSPAPNGESLFKAQIQDDVNKRRTLYLGRLDQDGQIIAHTFHGVQYPKVSPPLPKPEIIWDSEGELVLEVIPAKPLPPDKPPTVRYSQMQAQRLARKERDQAKVLLFQHLPYHGYDELGTLAPFEDSLKKGSPSYRFRKAFADNNPAEAAAAIADGARISKHDNPAESLHRRLFVLEWPHLVRAGGRQKAEQFVKDVLIEEAALGFQIVQQDMLSDKRLSPGENPLTPKEVRAFAEKLVEDNIATGQAERDATTAQRAFRGWRDRKALLQAEVAEDAAKAVNTLLRKV